MLFAHILTIKHHAGSTDVYLHHGLYLFLAALAVSVLCGWAVK